MLPAAAGVLLQFPLYGGIFGMIAYTGISARLAGWLVQASNQFLFPALIATYSAVLGVFVPGRRRQVGDRGAVCAGGRARARGATGLDGRHLRSRRGVANLLQPFWMLPILGILGLKARDIMGYTFTGSSPAFPAALIAVTLLAPRVTG